MDSFLENLRKDSFLNMPIDQHRNWVNSAQNSWASERPHCCSHKFRWRCLFSYLSDETCKEASNNGEVEDNRSLLVCEKLARKVLVSQNTYKKLNEEYFHDVQKTALELIFKTNFPGYFMNSVALCLSEPFSK